MEIQEMIEVLQRAIYVDGKCVNVEIAESRGNNWRKNDFPLWNFAHHNYRIKPEPKRMPLDYSDMLIGKCVIEKDKNTRRMIVSQATDSVLLSESVLGGGIEWYYYDKLMEYFTFLDGTPCSKESECE